MIPDSSHIFPLLYAGPISYYSLWLKTEGYLDQHENFQKQSFRNRCKIYGANGLISLSIPVKSNSQKTNIKNVEISNIEAWQRNHWRTLISAYKAAPFFEFYIHLWEPLYLKKYESLWEFNIDVHHTILKCLQIPIRNKFTTEFIPIKNDDPRRIFSSKKTHPLSSSFPIYQQVFSYDSSFLPDLSILDVLFNLGPETEDYLLQLDCELK
jgi:hypothetical protein